MSKKRFMLRLCLVCLVSFLVAMRTVLQDYTMHEDLAIDSSLLIVVKKMNIIQEIFQKEHRSELLKHFRCQVRYV